MATARSNSRPRVIQQCCSAQGQDYYKYSDGDCPVCNTRRPGKRPEEPHDFRQMLGMMHESLQHSDEVKQLKRSISRSNLASKSSRGHLRQPRSVDSLSSPSANVARGPQLALFPRSDSQLPPVKYKISRAPGERARVILVNEAAAHETRPLFKEVARGRGVLKGHRQERSDELPLRYWENPRPAPGNFEDPRPPPAIPTQRVTKEAPTRSKADFRISSPGEMLMPMCYEPPRNMLSKPTVPETPETTKEQAILRKSLRAELLEPLNTAPRPHLSPVPEIRDESIMERGRPVSRKDSQRNKDAFAGGVSPGSKSLTPSVTPSSLTPSYILPQTRYSPTKSTNALRPSPQPSPWEPKPTRKDSLDPISYRSDSLFRVVRALRGIDKSCLRLFEECEHLQTERKHLQREMTSVLETKSLSIAHISILRQQQQDLVELDAKIDQCMLNIAERQRRKTRLVDGLPEIQEMDNAEEEKEREMAEQEDEIPPLPPMPSPWGPRGDSLPSSAMKDGFLSPPLPSKKVQRETVTYAEIMDFLDEFD